jgi:coenzyme F420-reducing hydrogenase beta subunit
MRDQRTNSGMPSRPASKRCSACRAIKPVDEFYADRRGRLTGRCRDCHRHQTRANNRRRHAALRLLITAHMEEYRALLAAQSARPEADGQEADSSSIAGGGSDVA